jgi:hypothetical protein
MPALSGAGGSRSSACRPTCLKGVMLANFAGDQFVQVAEAAERHRPSL